LIGTKLVAFCSSDDTTFSLGTGELSQLNGMGIRPGMFKDNRGTIAGSTEAVGGSKPISYIFVTPEDAPRATTMLTPVLAARGLNLNQLAVVIDSNYPENWSVQIGKKLVAFSGSNDEVFRLGGAEVTTLNSQGIMAGMLRDNRGTVLASARTK
jgi:hypothetical protein